MKPTLRALLATAAPFGLALGLVFGAPACPGASTTSGTCETNADCGAGLVCNQGKCFFNRDLGSSSSGAGATGGGSSGGNPGGSTGGTPGGGSSGGVGTTGSAVGSSTGQAAGSTGAGGSSTGAGGTGGGCSCSASCCSQDEGSAPAGTTCPDGKYCYGTVPDGGGDFFCNYQTGKCDPFDPCSGASGVYTCGPSGGGTGSGNGGTTGANLTVDPSGVSFVVVGDTRPNTTCTSDSNCVYPTMTIDSIYGELSGLSPKPMAVIATGDFQYDSGNSTALWQIQQYESAIALYTDGPTYPVLGNHECDQSDLGACVTSIQNYQAFMQMLVDLKLAAKTTSLPYYYETLTAPNGDSAKFVMTSANTWDSVTGPQGSWLNSTLKVPSTFTFVARHQPDDDSTCSDSVANDNTTSSCPAIADVQTIINENAAGVTLKLNGHTHEMRFDNYNDAVISGSGGVQIESTCVASSDTYCGTGSTAPGFGFIYCQETMSKSILCTMYDALAGPVASPAPHVATNSPDGGSLSYTN